MRIFLLGTGVFLLAVMCFLAYVALFRMRVEGTGEFAPLWQRALLGGAMIAIGVGGLAGARLGAARYIARMERAAGQIRLTTVAPFGWHVFEFAERDVSVGPKLRPVVRANGQLVNAPGRKLRAKGYRAPFIVDAQAPRIDEAALERMYAAGLAHRQD